MIPGKPFDPATETSRRPTPERFAHLRKWVEPTVRNIPLTTITEITNITQQLEQSATLFINNIISRVIAQLTGKYGDGFVTIEGTEAGALHVHIKDSDAGATLAVTISAGTEIMGKIQVEGPGQTMLKAVINTAAGGPTALIAAAPGLKHHVTMIVLTVAGDTSITFSTAAAAMTGAMAFGGTDEPRGMVANHGNFPLVGGTNEAFNITNSGSVLITGYLVYYDAA